MSSAAFNTEPHTDRVLVVSDPLCLYLDLLLAVDNQTRGYCCRDVMTLDPDSHLNSDPGSTLNAQNP